MKHTTPRQFVPKLGRIVAAMSTAFVCLALSGCGNGLAQVSGLVTLDGQPLRGGNGNVRVSVTFQPASGSGITSIALADEDGKYTLATGSEVGVPPGDYVITCTASELVKAANSITASGSRRLTDAKYANPKTSGLSFTVQPGNNQFDIPLTSSAKTARSGS